MIDNIQQAMDNLTAGQKNLEQSIREMQGTNISEQRIMSIEATIRTHEGQINSNKTRSEKNEKDINTIDKRVWVINCGGFMAGLTLGVILGKFIPL